MNRILTSFAYIKEDRRALPTPLTPCRTPPRALDRLKPSLRAAGIELESERTPGGAERILEIVSRESPSKRRSAKRAGPDPTSPAAPADNLWSRTTTAPPPDGARDGVTVRDGGPGQTVTAQGPANATESGAVTVVTVAPSFLRKRREDERRTAVGQFSAGRTRQSSQSNRHNRHTVTGRPADCGCRVAEGSDTGPGRPGSRAEAIGQPGPTPERHGAESGPGEAPGGAKRPLLAPPRWLRGPLAGPVAVGLLSSGPGRRWRNSATPWKC